MCVCGGTFYTKTALNYRGEQVKRGEVYIFWNFETRVRSSSARCHSAGALLLPDWGELKIQA